MSEFCVIRLVEYLVEKYLQMVYIFVSPAKQKGDICIAFPASASSSSVA